MQNRVGPDQNKKQTLMLIIHADATLPTKYKVNKQMTGWETVCY